MIFSLALTSCSSDDGNGGSNTSGDIVGVWIGQDVDYTGSSTTEFQGQSIVADFVGEAYDVDYTLTFSEDPNEVVADGSYSIELTTTVAGQTQVDTVEDLEFLNDGTWSRSGDELTVVSNGETSVLTIVELTDTMLRLATSETEEVTEQGVSITTVVDVEVIYTRQ